MIFYLIVLLILLYMIFGNPFRPSREPYEFLTIDSETGDLAIVNSGTNLVALDGGGLKTPGSFQVDNDLTVEGNTSSNYLSVTGNQTVGGTSTVTGNQTVGGTLETTSNITSRGWVKATGSLCVQGACLTEETINWLNTLKENGVKAVNHTLCLGTKCFDENHFSMLRGEADVYLNGNGTGGGVIAVDGTYTNGHNIRYEIDKPGSHNHWRILSSWPQ
jgi:hypothetical protein